jgi:hypothetical protein
MRSGRSIIINRYKKPVESNNKVWHRILILSNILLVIFTGIYVVLSFYSIQQNRDQISILRKSFQESSKPIIKFKISNLKFEPSIYDDQHSLDMFGNITIKNVGNSHAKMILLGMDILPKDVAEINIRDSLLLGNVTSMNFDGISGRISKFIPSKDSIFMVGKWEDIYSKVEKSGNFFIHCHALYESSFNTYHENYTIFKVREDIQNKKYDLVIPPIYYFYDLEKSQFDNIMSILDKVK